MGEIPTIVFMKQKLNEPFMQELKDLPGIEYIHMDEANRDEITSRILKQIKKLD